MTAGLPRAALWLGLGCLATMLLGLAAGADGLRWPAAADLPLLADIRAPRTLGAMAAGALLGLAGALAQGLFRNPLADPYLLGSAAGASLGVTAVLAAGALAGAAAPGADAAGGVWALLRELGLVAAAFAGAAGGVVLALMLAGGAGRPMVLLLAGVVVGVVLTAVAELLVLAAPQALRARQVFLLGSTSFVGWTGALLMAAVAGAALAAAMRLARVLDALVLGDAGAASLGVPLPAARAALVAVMALATGTAVAQVGLVAFVGLVAPHLVRRWVAASHAPRLLLSALAGALLLGAADLGARLLLAPQELPVGVLTALLGGGYLLRLLHRGDGA